VKKNALRGQLTGLGATLALLFGYAGAQAGEFSPVDTYIVTTNTDDPNNENPSCSQVGTSSVFTCATLRDAISVGSNDEIGSVTINFAITDTTIVLGATLPQVYPESNMTIDGTSQNITIDGNHQTYEVLEIFGGNWTINALTIQNGAADEGGGIGVFETKGCNASLTVTNSTFYNNGANQGGAIYSQCPVNVVNSTFYKNQSDTGGAIYIGESYVSLNVTNSTFSTNTATTAGSAIASYAPVALYNTILAAELPASTPNPGNCNALAGAIFTDDGGNLSDDRPATNNSCNLTTGNNTSDASLNLGTLANNGGPTGTIALLPGSAAISSATLSNCPALDQRGVTRPSSGALAGTCSSGALQYPVTSTTTSSTGTVLQCTAPQICNLSGGDTQTVAAGTTAAATALAAVSTDPITENLCIIKQDPRQICGADPRTTPHYTTNTTFPVSEFCPGFGNTVVPDYLCGAYSSNGPQVPPRAPNNGLAVLQGISDPVNNIPGLLWLNDANPDVYFGFSPSGTYASECNNIGLPVSPFSGNPDGISIAWAPWSGSAVEGLIPENPRPEEVTDGCGGQKNGSGGVSITLIGVTMNLSNATQELGPGAGRNSPLVNLIEFADYKYANLFLEVAADDNIPVSNKAHFLAIVTQSALFLAGGNHACAETTLYDADNYVLSNANVFLGNSVDPNSYGRTRTRLLNLFYTLYTRIDMKVNPITNLAISVPFPLLAPGFTPPVCSPPHL
jgi:hypothetical protein